MVERVDESINFDWGSGPITPYGRDFVGVRWWGKVRPTTNEEYTFYVVADDAVRLYVDHELLIDAWDDDRIQHLSMTIASLEMAAMRILGGLSLRS